MHWLFLTSFTHVWIVDVNAVNQFLLEMINLSIMCHILSCAQYDSEVASKPPALNANSKCKYRVQSWLYYLTYGLKVSA